MKFPNYLKNIQGAFKGKLDKDFCVSLRPVIHLCPLPLQNPQLPVPTLREQ
jgi:hypothetical protein